MDFQDVEFLISLASFYTTFLEMHGRAEGLQLPHVLKLWLRVSKGMLPLRYFLLNNSFFVSA